jgi:hypothetical protein
MYSTTVPVIVAYATSGFYRRMSHLHIDAQTESCNHIFILTQIHCIHNGNRRCLFTNIVQRTM